MVTPSTEEVKSNVLVSILDGTSWDTPYVTEVARIQELIADTDQMVWIDLSGGINEIQRAFAQIAQDSEPLSALDPARATEGGENPPTRPPKAKAFRNCVFARGYWLGTRPSHEAAELVAQEIHLIAGQTFALTMRYPCLAWRIDEMAQKTKPDTYTLSDAGIDLSRLREGVDELRDRLRDDGPRQAFGLEVAAVILDRIVDSLFESLNALRQRADALEQDVLGRSWLWAAKNRAEPTLEERMLGMRRLLRHVRWAFMPSDEITELRSGPFQEIATDPGIDFRIKDLSREADRAVESVRDVTEQVEHTVDLSSSMKQDRLNDPMYVLTLVATVLLIPTLIAGIYGMNFRNIPLTNWGPGYWGILAVMIFLGAGVWFGIRQYLRSR